MSVEDVHSAVQPPETTIETAKETASKITRIKRRRKSKAPVIQADTATNANTGNGNDAGAKPNRDTKPARSRYSLDDLRLPVSYTDAGVQRVLNKIPVRRPNKQWFIQTHPEMRYRAFLIELDETGETYLVLPQIAQLLGVDVMRKELLLCITRQGDLFFWPIKLPDEDGQIDDWNDVAMMTAKTAETVWLRLKPNRRMGTYTPEKAEDSWPAPDWDAATQGKSLEELLLDIAFRDRVVDNMEHPVVKKLKGRR